jgi:Xaa-Pro aminopeptidase
LTTEVIERMGLTKSKIGFEKTYLSASRWEEFHRHLPDVEMFDCTELMDAVRWVKTPGEIDLLKEAADIQDEAYVEVFSNVGEGDTLREVHAQMVKGCMARGAEIVHGLLNTSRNNVRYLGEGDTVLERGDIVRTDYVSYLQGYPGHQSRVFVVGPPSEEQVEMYREYREVHLMTIDLCRPRIQANELFSFADQKLRDFGFVGAGNMVGHSVGPWFHQQQPLLVPDCKIQIEEGMVVAVEPFSGYWHLQDMVLVTRREPELLTGRFDTERLFVID